MSNATALLNAYVPASVQKIDGKMWMMFYNDGTFASYKEMPAALRYEGITYVKRGWNSDTSSVSYEQGSAAVAA